MKRVSKRASTAAVLALALATAGCGDTKAMFGSFLGAGAGAAIGSQIGGGTGQLIAVAVGTLAGALVGMKVAENINFADRTEIENNAQAALENNDAGAASKWKKPDSDNSSAVKIVRRFKKEDGTPCAEFEQTLEFDGEDVKTNGVACKKGKGWRVVKQEPINK